MSRRSLLARAAAPLAAVTVLLTSACGGNAPTTTPAAVPAGVSDLTKVTVTGAAGAKPTIAVPGTFSVKATTIRVLTRGSGPTVAAGQVATLDYTAFNGADGKEFDTTFGAGKKAAALLLDPTQTMPGMVKGVEGQTVGSRLLVAIPPADGLGTQGAPSSGIGPTDTLLVVVDVKGTRSILSRATGTAVAPKAGLPAVKLAADGAPTITLPAGNPPAQLVVQPLIVGKGARTARSQEIQVQYTGVIWPGGKVFDSSWARHQPYHFTLGAGRVIEAWDTALLGQTVGSQLLLVVPPDKGYGATGSQDGSIKGTDTLVFVVDILDAG